MPVPKRKRSRARRDKRFANKGLAVKAFAACPQCQTVISSHQVCKNCGHYKGIKIIETKADRAVKRGEGRKKKAAQQQTHLPEEKE